MLVQSKHTIKQCKPSFIIMSSAAKQLQRYTKYQYAVIFLRIIKIIILSMQFKCFIIKITKL